METLHSEEDIAIIYLKHTNPRIRRHRERTLKRELRENNIRVDKVFYDTTSSTDTPGIRDALQYCQSNPVEIMMVYDEESLGSTEAERDLMYHTFYTNGTEPFFFDTKWDWE